MSWEIQCQDELLKKGVFVGNCLKGKRPYHEKASRKEKENKEEEEEMQERKRILGRKKGGKRKRR